MFSSLLLTASLSLAATGPDYASKRFLEGIQQSQEKYFDRTVVFYDSLLARAPSAGIHLEKCRFMETALYDAESEENPRYEEWEECRDDLLEAYPDDVGVNLYRLEGAYGDSAINLANQMLGRYLGKVKEADDSVLAVIYRTLASNYSVQDSASQAIGAAKQALRFDPASKVHLILGEQYASLGMREKAKLALMDSRAGYETWEKKEAAGKLVDLRFPAEALQLYREAMADTAQPYLDYSKVALAFEQTGRPDSARVYLKKVYTSEYNASSVARKLFDFDLRNSSGRQALETYRAMRDHGFSTDPFSFHRLRLFAMHPWLPLQARELIGLLMILAAAGVALAAPYLWILPLHYAGHRLFRNRPPVETPFSLKHFWVAGSGMVMAAFLALGYFQPDTLIEALSDVPDAGVPTDSENAWFLAIFTGLMSAMALAMVLWTRTVSLFRPKGPWGFTAGAMVGSLVLLVLVKKVNVMLFPEITQEVTKELFSGSILTMIRSTLLTFGIMPTLILSAVLVPLYEELIFRGIGLDAMRRRLPFWIANTLQAVAFALAHDEIRLFPFYFTMGVLAGWLYRRSGSLFAPVLLHCLNNSFATLALWAVLKRQS